MSIAAAHATGILSSFAKNIVLNPIITGPLLWLLTRAPERYRSKILGLLGTWSTESNALVATKYLKTFVVLGIIRGANWTLNSWALSKWKITSSAKWEWNQEVAVVTGGCGGIGELTVGGLVSKGLRVAILDIVELPAQFQEDKRIQYFKCDVTKENEVMKAAVAIKSQMGSPSILVNNAGICGNHTILNTSDDYLHKIFEVNVFSNYHTVKAFLPDMLQARKGHVVTMASCASFISVANMVDYCATKSGILSFHEGLTQELKHRYNTPEILTSIVHPHWTNTSLLKSFEGTLRTTRQFILKPQVIADTVVNQITSRKSGQVIVPDGFSIASALRGMPHWAQEVFRDGLGRSVI